MNYIRQRLITGGWRPEAYNIQFNDNHFRVLWESGGSNCGWIDENGRLRPDHGEYVRWPL